MNYINIGMVSDDNYIPQMAALMASILENALPEDNIHFYIVDGGIKSENIAKLSSLQSIKQFQLDICTPDNSKYSSLYSGNWGVCTYYRLDIPNLFPEVDRMIYLDCDMIVRRSLSELWNSDLEGKAIGVSPDSTELPGSRQFGPDRLGIDNIYFNAGMILMDLKQIRQNRLFEKATEWLYNNPEKILLVDQDALNIVFKNDKKILPRIWNSPPNYYRYYFRDYYKNEPDFEESLENPAIVHYLGSSLRPWDYMYCEKWGDVFWKYVKMTPWKTSFKPRNKTFLNVVLYRPCKSVYMSFFYFQDHIRNKVAPAIENSSFAGNVMIKSIKAVLRLFRKLVRKH